jgi:hypothetical protein
MGDFPLNVFAAAGARMLAPAGGIPKAEAAGDSTP